MYAKADTAGARIGTARPTTFQLPLDALRMPKSGKAYDLSSGWWPGMPLAQGHPPFQVITYRTPAGERNQRDLAFLKENRVNFGFISELMMCTTHTGTHIDALGHITCGPDAAWHGGHSSNTELGDFGLLNNDAAELPPLVARGLMLDVPAALGLKHLKPHHSVGKADLEAACRKQKLTIQPGDVVIIRTGTMLNWPDATRLSDSDGSGLDLEGAEWLAQIGVGAVAGDNAALEVFPSGIAGDPQPVHRHLIAEKGVPILEWVNPEELARDKVFEFLFVCLPLTVKGATGSMVRPLAIV